MSNIQHKYLIIDTSILDVWLEVPDYETCGPNNDRWNYDRVNEKISVEQTAGTYFVLPFATIIETGNHITHIKKGDKRYYASKLAALINDSADNNSPWVAFSSQSDLWSPERLKALADRWLQSVNVLSLGDASIVDVAEHFSKLGEVEILSGDQGLKAYQPQRALFVPRRRQTQLQGIK